MNLTISNDFPTPSSGSNIQAVALYTTGDKTVLQNVRLHGFQDTLYVDSSTATAIARVYIKDSYIEGDTDFIFGRAFWSIDGGTIHYLSSRKGTGSGVHFAPSTPRRQHLRVPRHPRELHRRVGAPSNKISLGRSWDQSSTDADAQRSGRHPRVGARRPHQHARPCAAAATSGRAYSATGTDSTSTATAGREPGRSYEPHRDHDDRSGERRPGRSAQANGSLALRDQRGRRGGRLRVPDSSSCARRAGDAGDLAAATVTVSTRSAGSVAPAVRPAAAQSASVPEAAAATNTWAPENPEYIFTTAGPATTALAPRRPARSPGRGGPRPRPRGRHRRTRERGRKRGQNLRRGLHRGPLRLPCKSNGSRQHGGPYLQVLIGGVGRNQTIARLSDA
jgi:hypothetical protein